MCDLNVGAINVAAEVRPIELRRRSGLFALSLNGFDSSDQATVLSHLAGRVEPLGLRLKTQAKQCLGGLFAGRFELFVAHLVEFGQ